MAATFKFENGVLLSDGLQGCNVCDEALQIAQRQAKELAAPVILEDDDGEWVVMPDGSLSPLDEFRA